MNWRRVAGVVLQQWYLYASSPQRVLPLFIWTAIDILLWGFITRYLNSVAHTGFNFVPALLGAVLLWDFLTRVMQGVTTAFFEDVWSRNFLNVFATPIKTYEYLAMGLPVVTTGVAPPAGDAMPGAVLDALAALKVAGAELADARDEGRHGAYPAQAHRRPRHPRGYPASSNGASLTISR